MNHVGAFSISITDPLALFILVATIVGVGAGAWKLIKLVWLMLSS